jgi:rubrerythrin
MSKAKGPQRIEKMVELLRSWQGLEREAINTTAEIMEQTGNPLIRQVMEIIRNDSVQHHRVQQFLIDVLTTKPVSLAPQEMADIWGRIEEHDKLERKTIELAKQLQQESTEPVARILLEYLIVDEQKHDTILGQLEELKKHMAKLS